MNGLFCILNELKRNSPVWRTNSLHSCPALLIEFGKKTTLVSSIESYDKKRPERFKREKQANYDALI